MLKITKTSKDSSLISIENKLRLLAQIVMLFAAICHNQMHCRTPHPLFFFFILLADPNWVTHTGLPRSHQEKIPCVFPVLVAFSLCFFIDKKYKIL